MTNFGDKIPLETQPEATLLRRLQFFNQSHSTAGADFFLHISYPLEIISLSRNRHAVIMIFAFIYFALLLPLFPSEPDCMR